MRLREIVLIAAMGMLLPSLLLTPAETKQSAKLTLHTDQGISKDSTSALEYLHTKSSGFPRDLTNGTAPSAVNFKDRNVTVVAGTQPVLSNVFATGFTISWVMEINGTGKVSCSTDPNMSSPAPRWTIDGRRGIPSAVAYVNVTSCGGANPLTAGVTVYWRAWFNTTGCTAACIKGPQQSNVSWPQGIPFPAVRTKTSVATQSGNPTIAISPYEDRNTNGAYNPAGAPACNGPGAGPPADAPLCEFLVYLNHSGAGTLAFPIGFALRAFTPEVHEYPVKNYAFGGPQLRAELWLQLGELVRLRLGPEVQWIVLIDGPMRNEEGIAAGAQGALEATVGPLFRVAFAYRETRSFVPLAPRFKDVERYLTARIAGEL